MDKYECIMRIENFSTKDGTLLLSVSDCGVRTAVKSVVSLCEARHGGHVQLEMCPPYRKRTTGNESQNSHIWAHIQQISEETGNEVSDVEDYVKLRAVKRGYPYHINKLTGEIKPESMTKINTVEASYLIDELHMIAAEMEIELHEG